MQRYLNSLSRRISIPMPSNTSRTCFMTSGGGLVVIVEWSTAPWWIRNTPLAGVGAATPTDLLTRSARVGGEKDPSVAVEAVRLGGFRKRSLSWLMVAVEDEAAFWYVVCVG